MKKFINVFSVIIAVLGFGWGLVYGDIFEADSTSSFVMGIVLMVVAFIAAQLFMLPIRIAENRGHPNVMPIAVLTIAGGWTGILWIAALIWALIQT